MYQRWQFRSWDHQLGIFNYFNLRNSLGHVPVDIPDNQIQQFTGFLDADGKQIYEGDILERIPRYFEAKGETKESVNFLLGSFYLGPIPLHNYLTGVEEIAEIPQFSNLRIVGNIFSDK